MSLRSDVSVESICTVLSCTSDEFLEFYENENLNTDILSEDVMINVIHPNRDRLRAADGRYRLDKLLSAMLEYAPHPLGRRYVAIALHIAMGKGEDAVVEAAKAWMDYLFLPMLAISKPNRTEPSGSQTPTIEDTVVEVESADRSDQHNLRMKVATREQHCCAITQAFDQAHTITLGDQGRHQDIPMDVPQAPMEAAHIIPFFLNDFNKTGHSLKLWDAALTWDMLQSWTQIDFKKLVGQNINTPTNAIFMTSAEHEYFGRFYFYLDKEAYPNVPNKYMVRMTRDYLRLSNGLRSADAVFRTLAQSGVDPPDPEFIRIHAAFAKVLNLSAAAEYVERLEREAKKNDALFLNREVDFSTLLMSKLAVISH